MKKKIPSVAVTNYPVFVLACFQPSTASDTFWDCAVVGREDATCRPAQSRAAFTRLRPSFSRDECGQY